MKVHELGLGGDELGAFLGLEALEGALVAVEPEELLDVLVDSLVVAVLLHFFFLI